MRRAVVGCLGVAGSLVAAGAVVVGAVVLNDDGLRRVVADMVRNSLVNCATRSSLEATLGQHSELVKAVEAVGPRDYVMVGVESEHCGDDRAVILIYYATQDQRERIESLLEHGGLADAPVVMRNW